jgi:hypothetical protein
MYHIHRVYVYDVNTYYTDFATLQTCHIWSMGSGTPMAFSKSGRVRLLFIMRDVTLHHVRLFFIMREVTLHHCVRLLLIMWGYSSSCEVTLHHVRLLFIMCEEVSRPIFYRPIPHVHHHLRGVIEVLRIFEVPVRLHISVVHISCTFLSQAQESHLRSRSRKVLPIPGSRSRQVPPVPGSRLRKVLPVPRYRSRTVHPALCSRKPS